MKSLLPIDEINALSSRLREAIPSKKKLLDEIIDLFYLSYALGVEMANAILGTEERGYEGTATDSLYRKVDGKSFVDRINEYVGVGDAESIIRVIDTESHRIYNEGMFDIATRVGATTKTWVTRQDDKVRDTHSYLDGITIPLYADFITYDGDSAQYPGNFALASNNCNCRCELTFSK